MKGIKRSNIIYLFVTTILLLMGFGCPKLIKPESWVYTAVEYRYFWESPELDYDCLPNGDYPVIWAFQRAFVAMEVERGDSIWYCNEYTPIEDTLFQEIQERSSGLYPWYIESGLQPADGYDYPPDGCNQGDPCADSVIGLTWLADPYTSFSLVFVSKIRYFYNITNDVDASEMAAIHELGHQYGHLSDKYNEPSQHSPDTCCVMDAFHFIGGNNIEVCKSFCPMCIDSLKNVDTLNWSN